MRNKTRKKKKKHVTDRYRQCKTIKVFEWFRLAWGGAGGPQITFSYTDLLELLNFRKQRKEKYARVLWYFGLIDNKNGANIDRTNISTIKNFGQSEKIIKAMKDAMDFKTKPYYHKK